MTNEEASVIIGNIPIEGDDCYTIAEYQEAKAMAIKALEQTSHLIDRPCSACEFHKENGCCKWNCVFEEDKE